jgi:hypothetical protein
MNTIGSAGGAAYTEYRAILPLVMIECNNKKPAGSMVAHHLVEFLLLTDRRGLVLKVIFAVIQCVSLYAIPNTGNTYSAERPREDNHVHDLPEHPSRACGPGPSSLMSCWLPVKQCVMDHSNLTKLTQASLKPLLKRICQ